MDSFLNQALDDLPYEPRLGFEEERVQEAKRYTQAIRNLLEIEGRIGDSILEALWRIEQQQLYLFYPADEEHYYDSLGAYVNNELMPFARQPNTIAQYALIVDRVLKVVHAAEMNGKAYIDEKGIPITAERLVTTPGLISKLMLTSNLFSQSDVPDQAIILNTVVTQKRERVEALRDEMTEKKPPITIVYNRIPMNGKTRFILDLDDAQTALFLRLIGKAGIEGGFSDGLRLGSGEKS